MRKFSQVKKVIFSLVMVLAVVFIAGSCRSSNSGGKKVSTDATLKSLKFGATDATAENLTAAAGAGWDVGASAEQTAEMVAVPNDSKSTVSVTVNGSDVSPITGERTKFNVTLANGQNEILITVTPESGSADKKVYTVKASFAVTADNSTDLSSFKFSYGGTDYYPEIAADLTVVWSVREDVSEMTITAKPRVAGATVAITKSDNTALSTNASGAFVVDELKPGDNKFTLTVTAKDGTTKRNIAITIKRNTPDEDAKDVSLKDVSTLGVGGDFETLFAPEEFKYYPETKTYEGSPLVRMKGDANDIASGIVTVTPANDGQTIEVSTENDVLLGGKTVTAKKDGVYTIYPKLNDYENIVKVKVTSKDGSVTETYTVKVVKDMPASKGKNAPVWVFVGDSDVPTPIEFDQQSGEGVLPITIKPTPSKIKLTVKAKYLTDKSKIDGEPIVRIDSKEINLGVADPKAVISVKDARGNKDDYTIKFAIAKNDCSLKSLALDQNPRFSFKRTEKEYFDVALPNGEVVVTAVPNNAAATVTVNGTQTDASNKAKITVNPPTDKTITVKVTNGEDSEEYVLNIVPAATTPTVNAEILVVDSIGGTIVTGTTLKVFEAGTTVQVGSDYTVTNGKVTVTGLTPNKAYDFALLGIKGKHAGSRLENYFIDGLATRDITMYQYKHGQITRDVQPPKIHKIEVVEKKKYSGKPLVDNMKLDKNSGKINITFLSPSGEIYKPDGGGFGAKLAFGSVPTGMSGIAGENALGSREKEVDGVKYFEQDFSFDIGNIRDTSFPNGKSDLVVVAYDVANNRIEKHFFVEFDQDKVGGTLEFAEFENLFMITRRIPASASMFSKKPGWQNLVDINAFDGLDVDSMALNPVDGKSTSYIAILQFELMENGNPVPILGFDIYRKKAGTTDPFKLVSSRVYGASMKGSANGKTYHIGVDSDSRLEEGVEYEYKLVAFNETYRKESPVMKGKVLPAFKYNLISPAPYAELEKSVADAMDYSCLVTNKDILKPENADFINFGLLIMKKDGIGVFGAKCIYDYNGRDASGNPTNKPDLRVQVGKKMLSLQTLIDKGAFGAGAKLSDFVVVDQNAGTITLKNAFVKIGNFNLINGSPLAYEKGTAYQWDILNWGESPYSLQDDKPMVIGKTFNNGTKAVMESQSHGSDSGNSNNAANGRLEFTVK